MTEDILLVPCMGGCGTLVHPTWGGPCDHTDPAPNDPAKTGEAFDPAAPIGEIRAWAAANGIEVTGTRKADIVAQIEAAIQAALARADAALEADAQAQANGDGDDEGDADVAGSGQTDSSPAV